MTISLDGEFIADSSLLVALILWGPDYLDPLLAYLEADCVHVHEYSLYAALDILQESAPERAVEHQTRLVDLIQTAQAGEGLLRYVTHEETLDFVLIHADRSDNRVRPSLLVPIAVASAKNSEIEATQTYYLATAVMDQYEYDMPPEFDRAMLVDCRSLF